MIKSICVFCGSASGRSPAYGRHAEALGRDLAGRGISLVYGGGNVGTMGVLAEAAMKAGGRVIGIIPQRLFEMVDQTDVSELLVVKNMHERKALMQEKADAFIALPGGIGTMEELFEVWTWRYIGYHAKPVGLLNAGGFYDDLLRMLEKMRDEGFIKAGVLSDLCVAEDCPALVDALMEKERCGGEPLSKLPERRHKPRA